MRGPVCHGRRASLSSRLAARRCLRHLSLPWLYQKIHDLQASGVPASIDLLDDALVLTWSDDPSPHRIGRGWLNANAYDRPRGNPVREERLVWDERTLVASRPVFHDAAKLDSAAWTEAMVKWGFVVLGNLPRSKLEGFVASIGPISHYISPEPFISIKVVAGGGDIGPTSHALAIATSATCLCTASSASIASRTIARQRSIVSTATGSRGPRARGARGFRSALPDPGDVPAIRSGRWISLHADHAHPALRCPGRRDRRDLQPQEFFGRSALRGDGPVLSRLHGSAGAAQGPGLSVRVQAPAGAIAAGRERPRAPWPDRLRSSGGIATLRGLPCVLGLSGGKRDFAARAALESAALPVSDAA